MSAIKWNNRVKLILSDVDETVADLYIPADEAIISQLNRILSSGVGIFFITGQGLKGVRQRITDRLETKLRKQVLIAACSGAEVWGYESNGELKTQPEYSLYDLKMTKAQKQLWRDKVDQLIREFKLKVLPVGPVAKFSANSGGDPLVMMFEDRGPQITLEMANSFDLEPETAKILGVQIPLTHGHLDLRIPILEKAEKVFKEASLPITPKLGGVFALDFVLEGVSKTTAVKRILTDDIIIRELGIDPRELKKPESLEIWGDKFSLIRGGTDRHMCEAVDPKIRAIDFRRENPQEFLPGYNIVVWDGEKQLHEGLLEYLQSR